MHDALFAGQSNLSPDNLTEMAKKAGLGDQKFTSDLNSHRFKPKVDSDRQEGLRLGATGSFLFLKGARIRVLQLYW